MRPRSSKPTSDHESRRLQSISSKGPVSKKILFVGAGAIGSYIGAFLSRAGHAVTLVDAWAE